MTTEELEQIREIVKEESHAAAKEELQTALKPINRKLKKIDHSIELVLKYHDEMHIRMRKRVEKLEQHTGISSN